MGPALAVQPALAAAPNAMLAGPDDILPSVPDEGDDAPTSDEREQPPLQPPRRIFSLTDVALPSPVRSRVQVSISKQQAAARAAALAKAAAEQHSIAEAFLGGVDDRDGIRTS